MTRASLDLSLYLITDTAQCGARGVPATVAAAVEGGASVVQLRNHEVSDEEFVSLGRAVRAALAGTGVPLIVDDRVHLVEEIGADGVHVGQFDMPPSRVREVLGPDAIVGHSASNRDQIRAAYAAGAHTVDYVGAGPVWATSTKSVDRAPLGPEGIARLAQASPWPVVAIGGIVRDRLPALLSTGAAGVAVVSAVCAAPDPALAAAGLRATWRETS